MRPDPAAAPSPGPRGGHEGHSVVSAGLVPPGAGGVRDYGDLLVAELRRQGVDAEQVWVDNDGHRMAGAWRAAVRLLRFGRSLPPATRVLWRYSSFAYGWRGLPFPGVLFGLVLRRRGVAVVTVLHELAYPWGRRGLRGRAQAVAQWAALPLVMLGSTETVVTTEGRAATVRRLPPPLRRPVDALPVFSTVEVVPAPPALPPAAPSGATLGVVGYAGDGARPELLLAALARLGPPPGLRVRLVGFPGPGSPDGRVWSRRLGETGLGGVVEFTDVLPPEALSRCLQECDLLVFLNDEGPSSRRTTVAAALAHGRPLLCLDGPDRWDAVPVAAGAVAVVAPGAGALAAAMGTLLGDEDGRRALGRRGRRFYEDAMGVEAVARRLAEALAVRG